MVEKNRTDGKSRLALGGVALVLVVTNGLRLWNRHEESQASRQAMADIGTERDPFVQLTMPVEDFFCGGSMPAYCKLEGKWARADSCEGKQAVRDELLTTFKSDANPADDLKIRNGLARVMMDTNDFCKGKGKGGGAASP
jgi:hypothetical protein